MPSNPSDPTHESPFDDGEVRPRHVGLFCDDVGAGCETEVGAAIMAGSREQAFEGLRRHAETLGWQITPTRDYCPEHRR